MNIVHYKFFRKKYLNLIKIQSNQIKLDKIFEKNKIFKNEIFVDKKIF